MELNSNIVPKLLQVINEVGATKNGPYGDVETPVRVLAHKLRIASILMSGSAVADLSSKYEVLLSMQERPFGGNYRFREPIEKKDSINGLMGPAWALEGLLSVQSALDDHHEIKKIILEILCANEFCKKYSLWMRRAPCGTQLGIDYTFNHQLWYCSMVLQTSMFRNGQQFLENQIPKIKLYKNGVINHHTPIVKKELSIDSAKSHYYFMRNLNTNYEKSLGYHAFNLLALARCKVFFPDLPCWESPKIRRILEFQPTETDLNIMSESKYADIYNPQLPGYLLAEKAFGCSFTWLKNLELREDQYDYLRRIRNYEYLDLIEIVGK
jgi:hypothetical protein